MNNDNDDHSKKDRDTQEIDHHLFAKRKQDEETNAMPGKKKLSNKANGQTLPHHPACQFQTDSDKQWLDLQNHDGEKKGIKKPNEIENEMKDPPHSYDNDLYNRIAGSMIGMALGDALGAHVEFRPQAYLRDNPVQDLQGGGTWGLGIGQFTDDTSMALCLANSLVARKGFVCYDQLVRYKWWYLNGYMSSTGECFDIGAATSQSLQEFARRQKAFAGAQQIPEEQLDFLSDENLLQNFDVFCSEDGVAGNGALMRLTPVPLFFSKYPKEAVEYSGISGQITHGDKKAYDACRYYGALIVAALQGETKEQLLDKDFYFNHKQWFDGKPLHPDVINIAQGSYKKVGGYDDGIRGKGYIINAIEAALWAFWSDDGSFEKGALAAVNLGDDTDTTAAIYGQLAGAYYGYRNLPSQWVEKVYAKKFLEILSKWITYEGQRWQPKKPSVPLNPSLEQPSKTTPSSPPIYTNIEVIRSPSIPQPHDITSRETRSSHQFESSRYDQVPPSSSINHSTARSTFTQFNNTTPTPRREGSTTSASHFSSQAQSRGRTTYRPINSNKHLINWSIDDVYQWIRSLGDNIAVYSDILKKNNVDGYCLYTYAGHDTLRHYGVDNKDHRQQILDRFQQLRKDRRSQSSGR